MDTFINEAGEQLAKINVTVSRGFRTELSLRIFLGNIREIKDMIFELMAMPQEGIMWVQTLRECMLTQASVNYPNLKLSR